MVLQYTNKCWVGLYISIPNMSSYKFLICYNKCITCYVHCQQHAIITKLYFLSMPALKESIGHYVWDIWPGLKHLSIENMFWLLEQIIDNDKVHIEHLLWQMKHLSQDHHLETLYLKNDKCIIWITYSFYFISIGAMERASEFFEVCNLFLVKPVLSMLLSN